MRTGRSNFWCPSRAMGLEDDAGSVYLLLFVSACWNCFGFPKLGGGEAVTVVERACVQLW
jgi:hypothetical protein